MAKRFHAAKEPRMPFNERAMGQTFRSYMEHGVVFITGGGFLMGVDAPSVSNADYRTAFEVLWWAEDGSGRELRKAFEWWGKSMGCADVEFSHPWGEPLDGMMDRAGYSPATKVWRKAL